MSLSSWIRGSRTSGAPDVKPEQSSPSPPGKRALPPMLAAARKSENPERLVIPPVAAASLLAWLQSEGIYEWITADELNEAWRVHREDLSAWDIPTEIIREQFAALPGVKKVRTRIAGDPQFGPVRARIRAQLAAAQAHAKAKKHPVSKSSKALDRPVLFYIPVPRDEAHARPVDDAFEVDLRPKSGRTERDATGHGAAARPAKASAKPAKSNRCEESHPLRRAA